MLLSPILENLGKTYELENLNKQVDGSSPGTVGFLDILSREDFLTVRV